MKLEFLAEGNRLDVEMAQQADMTRSRAAALIREGCVSVNGKTAD